MKKMIIVWVVLAAGFLYGETSEVDDKSLYEKQQEILRYGLEADVLTMLEKTDTLTFDLLQEDLKKLFLETKSPKIRERLFMLFAEKKDNALEEQSLAVIGEYDRYNRAAVRAAILYLRDIGSQKAGPLLRKILDDHISDYTELCITALGKVGTDEDALFLVEYFETEVDEDGKAGLAIRQQIMAALAELHNPATRDFLIAIAEDENENKYIRSRAVTGLGKIGRAEDTNVLVKLFEDTDPLLRTAAVEGLAGSTHSEAQKVLLQAFKDSYYKVRLQAIEAAVESKNVAAVPYVFYRAKTDPEEAVKNAAIDALALFNVPDGNTWLVDNLLDAKKSESFRIVVGRALIKHSFDNHYDAISQAMFESLGDEKQKKLRYALGSELAKLENPSSMPIAQAYLESSDPLTLSIGLDMFYTNKYAGLRSTVEEIAEDEKKGAIQRRAQTMLE